MTMCTMCVYLLFVSLPVLIKDIIFSPSSLPPTALGWYSVYAYCILCMLIVFCVCLLYSVYAYCILFDIISSCVILVVGPIS